MRYFLDTEFIEDGKTIDLISIGIVAEDGREYYAVSTEFNPKKASDWVVENVLNPMGIDRNGWITSPDLLSPTQKEHYLAQRTREQIKHEILIFCSPEKHGYPEFWSDFAAYDWVVFCQLFGTMMDLPKRFPMYCNDIRQLWNQKECPELPKQNTGEHHALYDARWNKKAYDFLVANYPVGV